MGWPHSQDYNEAIQTPRACFADPELRDGIPALNALGIPVPVSGNFADVYAVDCRSTGNKYAVKCFTREVPGLRDRYHEVSRFLGAVQLPFAVDFQYLDEGIRVRGRWFPVVKMRWVEGFALNEFVRSYLDNQDLLDTLLLKVWLPMAEWLRKTGMAHCDLQHGNVLLAAGSAPGSFGLKLIDYDGMFVPALARKKSGEFGHPAYQHPQRLREGTYNLDVDRFPLLAVAAALRCLRSGGRALWDKYDNGDNLLFRGADFRDPDRSPLFAELRRTDDPLARRLVERLAESCRRPLEETPWLGDLLPNGTPAAAPAPAAPPAPPKPARSAAQQAAEKLNQAIKDILPAPPPAPPAQPVRTVGASGDYGSELYRRTYDAAPPAEGRGEGRAWTVVAVAVVLLFAGAVFVVSLLVARMFVPAGG